MKTAKINSLQMLRAFAVTLVIFLHLVNLIHIPHFTTYSLFLPFYNSTSWPAIGVDLFFVISGFIMTIVAPSYFNKGQWREFLLKRVIRIIPIYYLISLMIFIAGSLTYEMPSVAVILKSLFFFPFFDRPRFVVPIIAVGWSLSYEIYFYLLITIFLVLKKNHFKILLILIAVLASIGAIVNPTNTLLKFLTSPLLFEFSFGIICGLLYQRTNSLPSSQTLRFAITLTVIGLFAMLASLFYTRISQLNIHLQEIVENDNSVALLRTLIWGLPCALFLLGVVLLEKSGHLTIPGFLIKIGDASYSAYLLHILVYQAYSKIFIVTHLRGDVFLVSSILVCLISSVVFYSIIEKPLGKWLSRKFYLPSA